MDKKKTSAENEMATVIPDVKREHTDLRIKETSSKQ